MSNDVVNHPEHYTSGTIEPVDFIESQQLNFNRGNVVKYVARAGRKKSEGRSIRSKELEDLKKARFYLQREIDKCEKLLTEEYCNGTN